MPRHGANLSRSPLLLAVLLACAACPSTAAVNRCQASADCAPRWACVNEICRAPCNASADCLGSEHCSDGLCLPGDRSDAASIADVVTAEGAPADLGAVDAGAVDLARTDLTAQDRAGVDTSSADHAAIPDSAVLVDTAGPDRLAADHGVADGNLPDNAGVGDACTPRDCNALGLSCGPASDGCGRSFSCGTCPNGTWCVAGLRCEPPLLQFVSIQAGTFSMGSPVDEPGRDLFTGDSTSTLDETPHDVRLTRSFQEAATEVTQAAFALLLGYNPAYFAACGDACPVERVSWSEAARWCNALSDARSLERCYGCSGDGAEVQCSLRGDLASPGACLGYRLPTEAEWEYSARAGSGSAVFSGAIATAIDTCVDEPSLDSVAWYLHNADVSYTGSVALVCDTVAVDVGTHPVGLLGANSMGLRDVAGNVWEWVHDCAAPYPAAVVEDPVVAGACGDERRVFRGGSVGRTGPWLRHAERAVGAGAGVRAIDIGFRPVRTLP